jgi:SPP1 family predicted phage head-tail adaptor
MATYLQTPTGQLNQRVRIERANLVSDGQGGQKPGVPPWVLRAVVWALVEPLSSKEAQQAHVLTAQLNVALTLHFRDDLSITDRILIGARVLHLQSYQDQTGRRAELRVLCTEVQS